MKRMCNQPSQAPLLELKGTSSVNVLLLESEITLLLGMSKLPSLCNYFHNVMAKFVWSKGDQQSDLGYLENILPIGLFTAQNACKRVI